MRKKASSTNSLPHPFYLFSGCIITLLIVSFVYQFGQLSTNDSSKDHELHREISDIARDTMLRGDSNRINNPVTPLQFGNQKAESHSHFLESTVLLIICMSRQDYLKRTLDNVVKYHPKAGLPILISEDGYHRSMDDVIDEATRQLSSMAPDVNVTHVHHPFHDEPSPNGYYRLSKHFKWAINAAFQFHENVENVIILEEDLVISPDFFSYFSATSSLLSSDPSLLAISAWNDNGQSQFVKDEKQLYRSDFFPGLGWMINKRIWDELYPIWPAAYWDDWLRYDIQTTMLFIKLLVTLFCPFSLFHDCFVVL